MLWNVCFYLSISILILFFIFIIITKFFVNKSKKNIKVFNWLIASIFLSACIAFYPVYYGIFNEDKFPAFKSFLLSLHNAVRMFVLNAEYMFIIENIKGISRDIKPFYTTYIAILFVLSPIFTFGFILSFFKNLSAVIRYRFNFFHDIFIFSELNEKSITLAKDLKNNDFKRVIVFCDVFENNEEKSFELISEARKLGAICFKKDILNINFKLHSTKKQLYFFTIGEEKKENINQSLRISERYNHISNSHLFMFSNDIGSEMLMSTINNHKMKVRRINEAQALINFELYNNPGKIFSNATISQDATKMISAIMIGTGEYGSEMLKTLIWFCQMDGYKLKINAFDKNPSIEDEFAMQCPEILDSRYNGVEVSDEAYYDVSFTPGVNVNTKEFIEKINQITDATFVFVALGTDEENIKTAVDLRMTFERMKIKPIIQTVVQNTSLAKGLNNITNYNNQKYDIDFIGDFESIYSETVILDSPLEKEALSRHMKLGKEDDFWNYEFNYRFSIASAIHMKAKIACKIPGAGKKEEELTEKEYAIISALDHRRWNAYMRSQGYIYSGSNNATSRNDLGKMHNFLVAYNNLSEEDKKGLKGRR